MKKNNYICKSKTAQKGDAEGRSEATSSRLPSKDS